MALAPSLNMPLSRPKNTRLMTVSLFRIVKYALPNMDQEKTITTLTLSYNNFFRHCYTSIEDRSKEIYLCPH